MSSEVIDQVRAALDALEEHAEVYKLTGRWKNVATEHADHYAEHYLALLLGLLEEREANREFRECHHSVALEAAMRVSEATSKAQAALAAFLEACR